MIRYRNVKNEAEIFVNDDVDIVGTNWKKVETANPAADTTNNHDDAAPDAEKDKKKSGKNSGKKAESEEDHEQE